MQKENATQTHNDYLSSSSVSSVVDLSCEDIIQDLKFSTVTRWKDQHPGGKAIGYFPVYAPVELIHACGMLPVGLNGAGEHVAEFTGAPLYTLDVPFMRMDEPSRDDINYVVRQLEELVERLEELTGRKFDYDRFTEAVRCSARTEELWSRIKHLARTSPSPFDAYFDAITLMGPLYVYRAQPEGVEFFEIALRELEEKVEQDRGTDKEKFRLVFEGPPPYPHFRTFRDMFAKWKATAVASTYSTVGGLWEFGALSRWRGAYRSNRRSP